MSTPILSLGAVREAVESARPSQHHRRLQQAIGQVPGCAGVRLVTLRDGYWKAQRSVWAAGRLVADDLNTWLAIQLASDGGDLRRTHSRLRGGGFTVSKTEVTRLFFTVDTGSDVDAFAQFDVDFEDCRLDRELCGYSPARSLEDWARWDQGDVLPEHHRQSLKEPTYRFNRVMVARDFLAQANELERERRAGVGCRLVTKTMSDGDGPFFKETRTFADWHESWDRHPVREQRLFDDWVESSAGRSGERLNHHWAFDWHDHTDSKGIRSMGFVPLWAPVSRIGAINPSTGNVADFVERLARLDRRMKTPFAWYFYMLHGNRVTSAAGDRVIAAVESGDFDLPDHDFAVLKRWQDQPYGF